MKKKGNISVSAPNELIDDALEVMRASGGSNFSAFVVSALESYVRQKKAEQDAQNKTLFLKNQAKPILRDYFRSIKVDHIPNDYVFITDGTMKKVQKYLKDHNVDIDTVIIKESIVELTMEER